MARAARAEPATLLDPRAPPYPSPAPGASGPLHPRRPGSIQTVRPKPRAALPPRPAFLTGNSRRRRLHGAAPAPPRGAGGRVGVSPLLTKQRSRRCCRRARVSLVRAPAGPGHPPTPPAPPLRAHLPASLPPTDGLCRFRRPPASCARPSALPLAARVRANWGGCLGEVGGAKEQARRTHLPALSGTVLRLRTGVCIKDTPLGLTPPSMRSAGDTAAMWWS